MRLKGRMRCEVKSRSGVVIAERHATNIVLRNGATLVANLFSGAAGFKAINTLQVGFGTEQAAAEATALTPPPAPQPPATPIPPEALKSPIAPANFSIVTDKPGLIQVTVASVFHPTVDLDNVSEAGLLGGDQLYNQVVFEPVPLRVGQDVTFFWEVDFPFGH
jgi:hypothetical protein